MKEYEEMECRNCGKLFRRVKGAVYWRLPSNIRKGNTVTCSKECSRIYTRERGHRDFKLYKNKNTQDKKKHKAYTPSRGRKLE